MWSCARAARPTTARRSRSPARTPAPRDTERRSPDLAPCPEIRCMNALIRFSLGNPRAITVLMLTVVIGGAAALGSIPADILPVYKAPAVQVLTFYGGMSATNVEADITSRMERWLIQASGTRRQESRSVVG